MDLRVWAAADRGRNCSLWPPSLAPERTSCHIPHGSPRESPVLPFTYRKELWTPRGHNIHLCCEKCAEDRKQRSSSVLKKESNIKHWCLRVRQVARKWVERIVLSVEADIFRGFASQIRGLTYTCHKSCFWNLTFKNLWLAVSWLEENELICWKEQSMTEEDYINTKRAEGVVLLS